MSWPETIKNWVDDAAKHPIRFLLTACGLVGLALCLVTFLEFDTAFPYLRGFASLSAWEVRHTVCLVLLIVPFVLLLWIAVWEKRHPKNPNGGLKGLDDAMQDRIVIYYLRGLKDTYLRDLARFSPKAEFSVRVNLMMLCDASNSMKISHCDYEGDFSPKEQNALWEKCDGSVGRAWTTGKQAMYAEDISSEDARFREMGIKPPEVTSLKSVLSTPVKSNNLVVALINLDSPFGNEETHIREDFVRQLFADGAKHLVPLISTKKTGIVTR